MVNTLITTEIMEFMVWLVEIVSHQLFNGNKTAAYNKLRNSGLWDIYVKHYETTHTLGEEYLLNEIQEFLVKHETSSP